MTFAVKFGAEWCYPCKRYDPVLAQLVEDEGYEIYEVDADSVDVDVLKDFGVQGLPTTVFFNDNGEVRNTVVGAKTSAEIKEQFNE